MRINTETSVLRTDTLPQVGVVWYTVVGVVSVINCNVVLITILVYIMQEWLESSAEMLEQVC